MGARQLAGVELPSLEGAWTEVVDDHIRLSDEPAKEGAVGWRLQVGGEAQLVSIDTQIVGALPPVVEGRPPTPRFVAGARPFDLYDESAQVAEHHRAQRAGQNARKVQNFDSGEHVV